jgi:hypothetical protein
MEAFVFIPSGDAATEEHFFTVTLEDATIAGAGAEPGDEMRTLLPHIEQQPLCTPQAKGAGEVAIEELSLATEGLEFGF